MALIIRRERPDDYQKVEALIREAFWNVYTPGCSEHYLAHVLREDIAFVPELDLVAVENDKIVGSIFYSLAQITSDTGDNLTVLCFGPLAVLPEYQGQGIGRRLIEETKAIAKNMGYPAILICGNPDYYIKSGFLPASRYGIGNAEDEYVDALLACELRPGTLAGWSGRFIEADVFNVDAALIENFDAAFPPKEKIAGLPSQQDFEKLANARYPRKQAFCLEDLL